MPETAADIVKTESTPQFTPGPWLWRVESEFIVEEDKPYGAGLLIAEICRVPEEQRKANARLIAAAPELYEALEACLEQCIGCAMNHYGEEYAEPEHVSRAVAALAKARGEA